MAKPFPSLNNGKVSRCLSELWYYEFKVMLPSFGEVEKLHLFLEKHIWKNLLSTKTYTAIILVSSGVPCPHLCHVLSRSPYKARFKTFCSLSRTVIGRDVVYVIRTHSICGRTLQHSGHIIRFTVKCDTQEIRSYTTARNKRNQSFIAEKRNVELQLSSRLQNLRIWSTPSVMLVTLFILPVSFVK